MGRSKQKIPKQKVQVDSSPAYGGSPDSEWNNPPSWAFSACDTDPSVRWNMCRERIEKPLWGEILPKLREFERQTLNEIFVTGKKNNHKNNVSGMNKAAQKRLEELHLEYDALYSLHLKGKLRLYGYIIKSVFYILWYDDDHGDNDTCVYRSSKKHT